MALKIKPAAMILNDRNRKMPHIPRVIESSPGGMEVVGEIFYQEHQEKCGQILLFLKI